MSLTVTLPGVAINADHRPGITLGSDCRWLTPDEDHALYGTGEALRLALSEPDGFEAHRAAWTVLDDGTGPAPVAFWAVPPALEPSPPTLWVPRVLLWRHTERTTLTVSLRRDATPVAEMAPRWLADARALVAGYTRRGLPSIAARAPGCSIGSWTDRVRRTTDAIAAGRIAKAVLARRLRIDLTEAADPQGLADRLADLHPSCCTFALPHGGGHVVAASPERLAVKRGARVVSTALAGTAPRHTSSEADARAAADLLASPKERREHAIVADAIAEALGEVCETVERPDMPGIMRLRQVQHLWTPVTGRLRPGAGLLDVVTRLHPTPAVVGWPRQAALEWLRMMNEDRDGLYTGVAGWIDHNGDGEAAMVLRSAFIDDRSAVLWAGAGIMAESDPIHEWAEIDMKLSTMLNLFGEP